MPRSRRRRLAAGEPGENAKEICTANESGEEKPANIGRIERQKRRASWSRRTKTRKGVMTSASTGGKASRSRRFMGSGLGIEDALGEIVSFLSWGGSAYRIGPKDG